MLIIVVEITAISYENSIFIEFTIFTIWQIVKVSEDGLYCDCDACSENHVVLYCKIVISDNHNFTNSEFHNLRQVGAPKTCMRDDGDVTCLA